MSMIAAATLASCSKDDSDNKIDNNNNSVVEVEKTVENGVKETVENSVETISCPVTITVNKDNSISKVGVAEDGSGEVFTSDDQLRVYLDGNLIGTLNITAGGSESGTFDGQIKLPKSEDNTYPNSLNVTVLVSKNNSPLSGFSSTVYTDLSSAVVAHAYLSSSTSLTASTVAENEYPSYSANGISLVDQTSYIVFSAGFEGTNVVTINNNNFSLGRGSVLAFEGGLIINSTDLGISDWASAVGKKYNFNLSAVKAITFDKNEINLTTLGATADLTATIKPSTATSTTITWTSSDDNIVSVNVNGTVTAKAVGEATITATSGTKSATCLVRVNKKEVTFTEGANSLTLTYYTDQKWSELNNNTDNKKLGGYSSENNYVKILDKYLKRGGNYVKVDDVIDENGSYTLVSDAPSVTFTIEGTEISFTSGQTWGDIDETNDNIFIDTANENRVKIGNKYLKNGDANVQSLDVIDSTINYTLSDN